MGAIDLSVDFLETKLISSRIYEHLRDAIIKGKLREGQRLIENDLTKAFRVSRSPIREALHLLAMDGFVEIIPYKGATVTGISTQDVKEHFEVKAMVEGFAGYMGAQRFTGEQIAALDSTLTEMQTRVEESSVEGILEANFAFHKQIVDGVNNARLSKYYESLTNSIRRYGTIGLLRPRSWGITLNEHRQILEAIKDRDALLAEERSRHHALTTMDRVLATLRDLRLEDT